MFRGAKIQADLKYQPFFIYDSSMSYFVYILNSEKLDKYYIGSSHNPEKRLHYHNIGKKGWTKSGTPRKMVYTKEFPEKQTARKIENYIKKQKSSEFIISFDYLNIIMCCNWYL